MEVHNPLRKNKFLKIFKDRLHVSFKDFGIRWKHPNGKECQSSGAEAFYFSFQNGGIEIYYKRTKERFTFCYCGDIWNVLNLYQVLSVEQMSIHKFAFYRYIAALDKRTDKKTLMLMSLQETDSNVMKILDWRLNRHDKKRV